MKLGLHLKFLNKYNKYLENSPDIFTDDSTKATSIDLIYDTDLEDFIITKIGEFELIYGNIETIYKYQGEILQYIEVYSKKSKKLTLITINNRGIKSSATNPKITKEESEAVGELCEKLASIALDIIAKAIMSPGSLTKLVKDMEDTMGKGKGVAGVLKDTDNVEEIIELINTKTKASVSKPDLTLDDYICNKELKDELLEIQNFMEKYNDYSKLGITLPKGILFKGEPGTGKTYAAKCIAGSTDCYFLTCTASSLQGMYIGSGTQNIRDIFEGAKKLEEISHKGVIIFIDEIDTLGNRDQNSGSASGEENRTLNQLLAEMSGFEENQRIMVMAATNYEQRLDSALKRSGRFSRHITIGLPDEDEREYLLEYYFNKLKLPLKEISSVDLLDITENLTPADIKEIANEAAILSVRQELSEITLDNINEAINKVITKNTRNRDKLDIKLISAHEAGHVLAEYLYTSKVSTKVTSYSYGDAGGFTQSSFKLKGIMPKDMYLAEVKILLAGRAAEQVICNTITGGAISDLERAKKIMKSYYKDYNFDKYEVEKLDQIVLDNINEYQEQVIKDFETSKKQLETLTKELVDKRVLYKKDLARILIRNGGIF